MSETLRIAYPPLEIPRYYLYSFLQLLSRYAEVDSRENYVEIKSNTLLEHYKGAFELVLNRLEDYVDRTRKIMEKGKKEGKARERDISIPLSGNDKKPIKNIKIMLRLSDNSTMLDVLRKYIEHINDINLKELQDSLYPFRVDSEISPISIFNVELYGSTRGPYFKSGYKMEYKLSIHQFMILLAGYINARCFRALLQRTEKGFNRVTVLIFPASVSNIPEFLIKEEKTLRIIKDINEEIAGMDNTPASVHPLEGIILWFLLNLSKYTDVYMVGMEDPVGNNPASIAIDAVLPLSSFYTLCKEFIDKIKGNDYLKRKLEDLIKQALRYPSSRSKPDEDAFNYVKSLFLAIQADRYIERVELALRASKIEAELLKKAKLDETDKARLNVAECARVIAQSSLAV